MIEVIVRNILGTELFGEMSDIRICDELKYLLIFLKDGDDLVSKVSPDFTKLSSTQNNKVVFLVIVTQLSSNETNINFNSRVFAPWLGVSEDPVCGSAHAVLAPYWNRQYEEKGVHFKELIGKHSSKRGGIIICKLNGERVELSGKTRTVVKGILKV